MTTKSQKGGNLTLELTKLAVPVGLTLASHMTRKLIGKDKKTQQVGGTSVSEVIYTPISWIENLFTPKSSSSSRKRKTQQGGSLDFALLSSVLSDLSVPLGLTLAGHKLSKTIPKSQLGGASLPPVITDPIMSSYLTINGINLLSPSTLIPIGVLLAVYFAYNNRSQLIQTGGVATDSTKVKRRTLVNDLKLLVNTRDLNKYIKSLGIEQITPQTKFPLATVLGKQVFNAYVKSL